ncbi:MAG TPA: hypothetical protein VII75_05440 [Thermoanaerobaculia bacterium]|nr:hypothetical protein [Thermoanaerobaculia bacterium]
MRCCIVHSHGLPEPTIDCGAFGCAQATRATKHGNSRFRSDATGATANVIRCHIHATEHGIHSIGDRIHSIGASDYSTRDRTHSTPDRIHSTEHRIHSCRHRIHVSAHGIRPFGRRISPFTGDIDAITDHVHPIGDRIHSIRRRMNLAQRTDESIGRLIHRHDDRVSLVGRQRQPKSARIRLIQYRDRAEKTAENGHSTRFFTSNIPAQQLSRSF